jgi:hypothetical protein
MLKARKFFCVLDLTRPQPLLLLISVEQLADAGCRLPLFCEWHHIIGHMVNVSEDFA